MTDYSQLFINAIESSIDSEKFEKIIDQFQPEIARLLQHEEDSEEYQAIKENLEWELSKKLEWYETPFIDGIALYKDFLDEVIKEMLDRKQFETDYSGEEPQKGAD